VINPPLESFGLWVEQLIAESTGKDGKGIVPVIDEPVGSPDAYGEDRTIVYLRHVDEPDPEADAAVDALAKAGMPVITRSIHGPTDLGRLFFFAEFAIAVAGWVLGVNPFDQPDVEAAKKETARVLETGADDPPDADDDALRDLLADLAPPNYLGILGFMQQLPALDEAVAELRTTVREATRAATTFGYGPRYLHSTGQLHKGGPPTGRFLQLIHDSERDVEVPDAPYTFNRLKHAQATGDLQTLRARGRRAERVTLAGDDPVAALRNLTERIRGLL
jgi:glucose-6-phosphate isomerase/transaldolase/glucose-6-phosphate isomerase